MGCKYARIFIFDCINNELVKGKQGIISHFNQNEGIIMGEVQG